MGNSKNSATEDQGYEADKSPELTPDGDLPEVPVTDPDATNVTNPDATLPPVAPDSYSPPADGHSTGNLVGNEAPPGSVPEVEDPVDFAKTEAENIEKARADAGITDAGVPAFGDPEPDAVTE